MNISPYIDRIGNIREMLIGYFYDLLDTDKTLDREYIESLKEEFGDPVIVTSEDKMITLTDDFICSYRFPDGTTILDRFVQDSSELSSTEKEIILKWVDPVVGVFEITSVLPDGLRAENLINEVEYTVKPTLDIPEFAECFHEGSFFYARIIPVNDTEYTFAGSQEFFPASGKAEIYKLAAEIQNTNREAAFRDNEERLQKGFELQKEDRDVFIECFGDDEIFTAGRYLRKMWKEFSKFRMEKLNKPVPSDYEPPEMYFPEEVLQSQDVGVTFDKTDGLSYSIDYGLMSDILEDPAEEKLRDNKEFILGYLEDESVYPSTLKRLFFKHPANAQLIIQRVLGRPDFRLEKHFDSLMREFKPSYYSEKRLPMILPVSEKLSEAMRGVHHSSRSSSEEHSDSDRTGEPGRNDPCPCGSGKKYKKCCLNR